MRSRAWKWLWVLAGIAACGLSCAVKPPHGPLGSPIEMSMEGPADNSFCHVCHLNMKKEPLALSHCKGGVGCAKCHGYSDEHSSDEDNVTPPEIMYPRGRINPSCLGCHNAFGTLEADRKEMLVAAEQKRCTDCHGQHRLTVRTRRWDKVTGRLTYDDGVRMVSGDGTGGTGGMDGMGGTEGAGGGDGTTME